MRLVTFLPHLLHIADAAEWRAAVAGGVYERSTRGRSIQDVGFIHMSFLWQVERVANFVYEVNEEPLVLLRIDPDQATAPIRVEALDGMMERFPHMYGALPVTAVLEVRSFERTGEGMYALPDEWHL